MLHLSNNLKEKKRKRNINIDLAVLPSHDSYHGTPAELYLNNFFLPSTSEFISP